MEAVRSWAAATLLAFIASAPPHPRGRVFGHSCAIFRWVMYVVFYQEILYRGTSLIKKRLPVGPYGRAMSRALWCSERGGAFSCKRGTSVFPSNLEMSGRATAERKGHNLRGFKRNTEVTLASPRQVTVSHLRKMVSDSLWPVTRTPKPDGRC